MPRPGIGGLAIHGRVIVVPVGSADLILEVLPSPAGAPVVEAMGRHFSVRPLHHGRVRAVSRVERAGLKDVNRATLIVRLRLDTERDAAVNEPLVDEESMVIAARPVPAAGGRGPRAGAGDLGP